jgi:hypothetical protein
VSAVVPGVLRVVGKPVTLPHEGEFVLTVDGGFVVVAGKVVADADGAAIPGADVLGGGQGAEAQFAIARTTTDAEGAFRLALPSGRESGMIVRAAGYASAMLERPAAGKPMEVRLVRGARVAGRVTLSTTKAPVAGATVVATSAGAGGGPFAPEPATTDAEGRYELVDLPAGDTTLAARGPGVVTPGGVPGRDEGWNPNAVTLEAGKTATLDLVVVPGARAAGKVVDAAGAPVAGATVAASLTEGGRDIGGSMLLGGTGNTAASGGDGAFAFDTLLPGRTYSFVATAPGHGPGRAGPVTATDDAPAPFTLTLGAVRTLAVTVLEDGAGTPVPGARVSSRGEGGPGPWRPASAVTDREGKALLGPVEAGVVRVGVEAEGYVRANDASAAADARELTVRLERGVEVTGRARLADGSPVAGATLRLEGPNLWLRETSSADGSFRFRGVPRTALVTLRASATGADGATLSATVEVRPGGGEVAVTLAKPAGDAETSALTVRVVGPDGKPVPRAEARFVSPNSSYGTNVRDGEVRFENLRNRVAGTVHVWGARARDGAPLPYGPARVGPVAPDVADLEVRMPAEAAIEGVVRAPDGRGLRGVMVSAVPAATAGEEGARHRSSDEHGSVRTGEGGTFRLGGLGEGDYVLTFRTPPEFVPPEAVSARGGASGVVVTLKAAATVTVVVLDPEGKPAAGARVVATPPGQSEWDGGGVAAAVDGSGAARLAGLDPARAYTLTFAAPRGRDDWKAPAPWANWMPKDETVRFERAYVVAGVVRDLEGNPVGRATVFRKGENGSWSGSSANEDGTFLLRDLSAGPVVLSAQIDGGRPHGDLDAAAVTVQAGDRAVVLRLDAGVALRVVVEEWGTARWIHAQLLVEGGGDDAFAGMQSLQPGRDARFRGLRPGVSYALFAGPTEDGRSALVTGLRAPGEATVTMRPGRTITVRVAAPPGAKDVWVNASIEGLGHVGLQGRALADGRFELRGAPEGTTWSVSAGAKVGEAWWTGKAQATAGGTVDVVLAAQGR